MHAKFFSSQASSHPNCPSARTIQQASLNPTWIENIAFRQPNGGILFGLDLLNQATARLLYEIPDVTAVFGMLGIADDVFAVVTSTFSTTTIIATEGSFSLWKVDLKNGKSGNGGASDVSKIPDIPEAMFINSVAKAEFHHSSACAVTEHNDQLATVLIANSLLGVVWKVDINTGEYEKVIYLPAVNIDNKHMYVF
ncbi:hypothetical protein TMatcc_002891 [Talaromyces marneffei ATCC 18224]